MPRAALLACAALVLLCLVDTGASAAEVDAGTDSAAAAAAGAGPVAAAPAPPAAPAAPAEAEAAAGPDGAKASDGARGPAAAAEGDAGGEDLGVNMEYVMIGAGAVGTLCCMAGGWFLLNQGGPKKRKFRGDAVFLVGPCDSGKTAVMFQLRDGESGDNKLRPTHTSMALNEETFAVAGIDCKPVRVIDFPGHSRLRPQLFDMIEDCRALIFVVDCSTFSSKAREIGSFVLDLLTSEKLLKNCGNMLIVCNKTDALADELAGISPKNMVKKRLETEIEALRRARAEGLDDIANSMRVELEIAGSVFKWTDAPVEVEFADGSARDGKLDPVKRFIAQNSGG